MVRIGFISTYNCQCGVATYTNYLGNALRDKGNEVMVFAEALRGNQSLDESASTLPYLRCWSREGNLKRLEKAIMRWKPDVVHVQYESALFEKRVQLLMLMNQLHRSGLPVVITFHDIISDKIFAELFSKASCSIVHHEYMARAAKSLGLRQGAVYTIIPHGSREVKYIDPIEAKKTLGIPVEKRVISVFGFVGKYKGHYTLLTLFSSLLEKEPNAFLLFAGGVHPLLPENVENHMEVVKQTIDANKDKMMMTGFILEKDLDTYIAASDVITFPHIVFNACSISGATHTVLGGGKPIVITAFPLYNDLTNDVNCLRFPPTTDMYMLPEIFAKLFESPDLCKKLGYGAKKLAEETSWKNVAAMTMQVYDKVLNDGKVEVKKNE